MSTDETTDIKSINLKLNIVSYTEDADPELKLMRLGVDGGIIIEPLGYDIGEDGDVTLSARMHLSDCPFDVASSLLRMAADALDEALANDEIKEAGDE